MSSRRYLGRLLLCAVLVACFLVPRAAHADSVPGDFNLQVTPSPLVTTVKPGTKSQVQLKVYNGGTGTENLKIEPRAFTISNDSKSIKLLDTTPPDISSWISFSAPKFTVQPGQWFSEAVILNVPKDAGFSYSFALVISRQSNPTPTSAGRLIQGSLAVFSLVNVDRPGATSNLSAVSFKTNKSLYEYLPTTFSITLHNSGNTIVQPYGNVFVSRSDSKAPISTMTVNSDKGYVLPDTSRTFTASWADGFPVYQSQTNANGTTSQKLIWNWGQLSHLRIGRYTANLVAIYTQNGRDVPIEGTVSFWVVPWKILLALFVVALLILFALFVLARTIVRFVKRRILKKGKPAQTPPPTMPTPPEAS